MELKSWGDWFSKNGSLIFEAIVDVFKVLKYKRDNAEPEDEEKAKAMLED